MVGAVRESVTLALGRLADQGEVEVRNRVLVIRRPLDGENRGPRRGATPDPPPEPGGRTPPGT